MDSGLIQRVRDLKASFGETFYNPAVLARVAEYNSLFGRRFDELFRDATQQIKVLAQRIQQQGADAFTQVDGDITVQHLEDIRDEEILNEDYRTAQERFRAVSRIKKAVDKRHSTRPPATEHAAATQARDRNAGADDFGLPAQQSVAEVRKTEDGRLRAMKETLRSFVRAADPSGALIVPMRHGRFTLQAVEAEAFRTNYAGETSFRQISHTS